ncbi:hypothetical protein COCNU_08G000760 [Cocos nucifera]|uniref:Uncharacterized protein n=1 Tax=Cocos nucifera TaxID=13894 RepID=A0A8K0IHE7_COCNU|nr:hypothetical protein COCNU_08G000760 [Cocos nucifera]
MQSLNERLGDLKIIISSISFFGDFGLLVIFIREDLFNAMQLSENQSGYVLERVENVWQEAESIAGISWRPMEK